MPALYELADQYRTLIELSESAPEDDQDAFRDTMEALQGEISAKMEGCAAVHRQLQLDASLLKAEVERLEKRIKAINGNADRLKQYMQHCLEEAGIDKVKGEKFTVALQLNPPKVVIEDESKIPADYMRIIPEQKAIDKPSLLNAIKAGEKVPGAVVIREKSLRIR